MEEIKKDILVATFGESEKGRFFFPHFFDSLDHLINTIGNPPPAAQGVYFAVQAILLNYSLIFFRVQEEGFYLHHYFKGLEYLKEKNLKNMGAICIPGMGDDDVIKTAAKICKTKKSVLIITEKDLYDYLTSVN